MSEPETQKLKSLNDKIDACLHRVLLDKPNCTTIRLGDDEWLIKTEGLS